MGAPTTTPGTEGPFTYDTTPLGKSNDKIRLLELFPSPDRSAALTCRIFVSSLQAPASAPDPAQLQQSHPYTALSYVWGDANKTYYISVTAGSQPRSSPPEPGSPEVVRRRLAVTESLHIALMHFRNEREKVVLWIDQICINQEDAEEKGRQVQLMRRIYSQAKQVLVWLGPAADRSDELMEAWRDIGQAARDLDMETYYTVEKLPLLSKMLMDPDPDDALAKRYQELLTRAVGVFLPLIRDGCMWKWFCRPWFGRAWVVQEFCLCEDTVIVCGKKRLEAKLVLLASQIRGYSATQLRTTMYREGGVSLEQMDKLTEEPMTRLFSCRERRRKFERGAPGAMGDQLHSLLKKLYVEHGTAAGEHRDRIYSLLGLAVDREALEITPDYTDKGDEATARILTGAARRIITNPTSGRIDLLCCTQFPKSPGLADHLPSWVPDWRGNLQRSYYEINEMTGTHLFAACGNLLDVQPVPSSDPRALGLRGLVVDTIEAVSPGGPLKLTGSFDAPVVLDFLSQVDAFVEISMSKHPSGADAAAAYFPSRERLAEARWRVPIADLYWTRNTYNNRAPPEGQLYHKQAVEALEFILECTPLSTEEQARRFAEFRWGEKYDDQKLGAHYRESLNSALSKRPFLTEKGYVGIACAEAKAGDVVVVFCGGRIPFVLRPLGQGKFAFVGEAYCDGIMDGEIVKHGTLQDLLLT